MSLKSKIGHLKKLIDINFDPIDGAIFRETIFIKIKWKKISPKRHLSDRKKNFIPVFISSKSVEQFKNYGFLNIT